MRGLQISQRWPGGIEGSMSQPEESVSYSKESVCQLLQKVPVRTVLRLQERSDSLQKLRPISEELISLFEIDYLNNNLCLVREPIIKNKTESPRPNISPYLELSSIINRCRRMATPLGLTFTVSLHLSFTLEKPDEYSRNKAHRQRSREQPETGRILSCG